MRPMPVMAGRVDRAVEDHADPTDLGHRHAQYPPAARIVAIARLGDIASVWSGGWWSHPMDPGEAIGLLGNASCRATEVANMAVCVHGPALANGY